MLRSILSGHIFRYRPTHIKETQVTSIPFTAELGGGVEIIPVTKLFPPIQYQEGQTATLTPHTPNCKAVLHASREWYNVKRTQQVYAISFPHLGGKQLVLSPQ